MENQKKIMIVEDDELMLKILEFILKKENYKISIAKDGLNAIERIPIILPDLIISNIMLPYKSGYEILSFVKQNYNTIATIILSALKDEESAVLKAFNLGADDFIGKPFNPQELLLRIRRLINKKSTLET